MHCRIPILCHCLVVLRPAPFSLRPSRYGAFRACRAVCARGAQFSFCFQFPSCEQYLSSCCPLRTAHDATLRNGSRIILLRCHHNSRLYTKMKKRQGKDARTKCIFSQYTKRQKHMPQIEQVKEEENLRWKKAGKEEVDYLWNEVPAGMENPSFEQVVNKRKREKSFHGKMIHHNSHLYTRWRS